MTLFSSLTLKNWRHLGKVEIKFHPRLTILTGANGAGKTTLLSLLSRHFGWVDNYVGTPRYGATGVLEYSDDARENPDESDFAPVSTPPPPGMAIPVQQPQKVIGSIVYTDKTKAKILIPKQNTAIFGINVVPQAAVDGVHIPSHRPFYAYQQLQNIPFSAVKKDIIFNAYFSANRNRYLNQLQPNFQKSPSYLLKEALVSLCIFGPGNKYVHEDKEATRLFERFEEILKAVMPSKLGFRSIAVRAPEVVLETDSGEFALDAVSGGIASIIDIAFQIFMRAPEDKPFVVTMDEPENHLHPELQRTLLNSLLTAFPQAQFIVASHNPFIVSSVPDSSVYVLDFDPEDHLVHSTLLERIDKSGSANDILRDVLGVPVTMPQWVQIKLEDLVKRYASAELTADTFANLRAELSEIGLGKFATDTIANVVERKQGE